MLFFDIEARQKFVIYANLTLTILSRLQITNFQVPNFDLKWMTWQ